MIKLSQNRKASTTCDICDERLSPLELHRQKDNEHRHCNSYQCKSLASQKEHMLPEQWSLHLHHHRLAMQAERIRSEKHNQQVLFVDTKEKREHEQVAKHASKKYSEPSANTLLVSLPTGPSASSKLPGVRKEHYIQHLKISMKECLSEQTLPLQKQGYENLNQPTELEKAPDFCATCKGGCCTMGKNTGYISAKTLQQSIAANPELSPSEIVNKYISFIPQTSITDSCINHGTSGCTIPREWRSDTCNRFFCKPVKNYFEQQKYKNPPKNTIIVQRSCTHWNRYALDQETTVTNIIYFHAPENISNIIPLDVLDET